MAVILTWNETDELVARVVLVKERGWNRCRPSVIETAISFLPIDGTDVVVSLGSEGLGHTAGIHRILKESHYLCFLLKGGRSLDLGKASQPHPSALPLLTRNTST